MTDGIPVFNLKDYTHGNPRQQMAFLYLLEEVLRLLGFFKFIGHGIDADLVQVNRTFAQEYFRLTSVAMKMALVRKERGRQRGHGELWSEHAAGTDASKEFDLKEFYSFGPELHLGHPYANDYDENIYPSHLPGWEKAQQALYKERTRVLMILLGAMSELLGMPPSFLREMAQHGNTMQRFIHYPALEEVRRLLGGDIPPGCLRSRRHRDINLLTLLQTGKGLNVVAHSGEIVRPEPYGDEMIAQSGDTFDDLSGGYFPATEHFVENAEEARDAETLFGHAGEREVIEIVPPMIPHAIKEVIAETERRKLCKRLNEIGHVVPVPAF